MKRELSPGQKFGRINAGYTHPEATPYKDRRVNLIYNKEYILVNVPLNLAKWKQKEMLKVKGTLKSLFVTESC